MSVKLVANYAKKLGLPGYSSHQFSVSVETELQNVENVAEESQRLYSLLQSAVDAEMQQPGFIPPHTYGMQEGAEHSNGDGPRQNGGAGISDKQIDLINRIVKENNVPKMDVENLAVTLFGNGVRALSRMQGSQLIDELFEKYGK